MMNDKGMIHDAIVAFKCKHCHGEFEKFDPAECHNCQGDLPEPRAHLRCKCGRAWLCAPAEIMQPSN